MGKIIILLFIAGGYVERDEAIWETELRAARTHFLF
jgi:hypothetical protein